MTQPIEPITKCLVCDAGPIVSKTAIEDLRYRETPLSVALQFSECAACGSEFTFPDQARANDIAIRDEYKRAGNLLSGAQVRAIRARLHLTQKEASQLFGGGTNSFAKYETDRVVQSKALDLLLRLSDDRPDLLGDLQRYRKYVEVFEREDLTGGIQFHRIFVKQPGLVTNSRSCDVRSFGSIYGGTMLDTMLDKQFFPFATAPAQKVVTCPRVAPAKTTATVYSAPDHMHTQGLNRS